MCGIVGVVARGGSPVDREVVREMAATLLHRGPDGEGSVFAPGVGFGHRRLAIVDLTPASSQPMVGRRGSVLTYNGEIYNAPEVRADLAVAGCVVASSGDTEVLLSALDTWGEAALARIEGMFAFGHWDPTRRTLLLARDRFGEKPLYYATLGEEGRDGVVFASEMRAMLAHPAIREARAIDPVSVAQYFLHEYVPAPRSIVANVKKLAAGHVLRWRDGGALEVARYYTPSCVSRTAETRSLGELARELTRLTERAVAARLVADVPVGVFLSGGLDSSFLAACASRVHPHVKTFTLGFDDASFDESAHGQTVARHLGTEHVEHRLSLAALTDVVTGVLDWQDEPFADSSLVPTTLLAREARREVTVALGGEGGDELLAGYPTFVVDQVVSRLPKLPEELLSLARAVAARVPADARSFSASFKARQFAQGLGVSGERRHALWLAPFIPSELAAIAGPRLGPGEISHVFDAVDEGARATSTEFDAATAFYLRLYLGEGVLTKVDRATMRASLEARAPLLDRQVAEFCLGLPPCFRVRGRETKRVMREAVRSLLPAAIVERPKKGFGAPVGAWLRGPLRSFAEGVLAPERVRQGGWLDATRVSKMLTAHVAGTADFRKPLYAALVFEHWRQTWCP